MVSAVFAKEGLTKMLRDMIAELYKVLHYPRILKQFKPSEDDIVEFIGIIIERALLTKSRYNI